jgi:rhamnose transport system permease protein
VTALSTPARVTTPRPASGSRLARMLKGRELGILLAIGALIAITAADNSRFLSAQSLRDIMLGTAILMVLAIGQSVVVITRNIDLSVGSVLGLSAFAVGSLGQSNPELPVIVALLAGLGFGAGCGLLNGILVRFGNVPALVVTLGTLYIFRGTGLFWAGGQQISADELPPGLLRFGTETVLGVPYLILVAVFVLIVTAVFLRTYRTGRRLYAMGSNPGAARLAGIRTGRLTLAVFIFSGALAGLAGVLYAARFATVDAAAGTGFELNVVAAVVVGGVAIFGGSGSVHGAALGAVLLTVIGSSLPALQIDPFWQQAVVGSLILLAIGADRLASVRAARSQRHADAQRRSLADGL